MKRNVIGFTLAELLIALAILGVIATYAVPKILTAQSDSKKQAICKETLAAIETLTFKIALFREDMNNAQTIRENVNAVKICDDALADGCWTAAMVNAAPEVNEPGFILANGAYVAGVFHNPSDWEGIVMDWNGPEPPNALGEDTFLFRSCFDPNGCTGGGIYGRMDKTYAHYQTVWLMGN
ncbi:MAG: type II secretion system protein [Candidatus Melainabacteria bacterium]